MPMQLYFKRAKAFISPSNNDNGTKKFLATPGPSAQPVPFWVADTETFKRGVMDKSIVNLTPIDQMNRHYAKTAPNLVVKAVPVEDDELDEVEPPIIPPVNSTDEVEPPIIPPVNSTDEDDDDFEQKETPKQEFGAQPMTPVAPAPKVGGITANGGRKK